MLKTVADIMLTAVPQHRRDDGVLVPLQIDLGLPFALPRVFFVQAKEGAVRGRHAHKQCTQIFLCVTGLIDVECDDGENKANFTLDAPNKILLIPPGIWATETYRRDGSVLAVLCDHIFDENDYLRDYGQFRAWREENSK